MELIEEIAIQNEVNEEYQQTELGAIPKDWHLKKFDDAMTGFSSGQTPSRSKPQYFKGNIKWITSGELNYNIITDTIEKITDEAVQNTSLKIIPKGTFLMAITGLEAEGTRGSCAITGIEATTNQSCMALYTNDDLLTEYLFHFYVKFGNYLALKYCQGTKQQSYTGQIARILPIILPPTKEEQIAIATALSDADALIRSLENLIAKKRNIKQGTMQLLLTGKKRLPEFSGEWEVKKLDDICNIDCDNLNGQTNPNYSFKYISLEDVEQGFLRSFSECVFSSAPSRARRKIQKNDILVSTVRPNLKSHLLIKDDVQDFICSTGFSVLRCKIEEAYPAYVYYHFFANTIEKQIDMLLTGSNYPAINSKDVKSIQIPLPSIPEQIAIAQILICMDAEIEQLEQRPHKYKMIKQGMMQNLLTGKIRLV